MQRICFLGFLVHIMWKMSDLGITKRMSREKVKCFEHEFLEHKCVKHVK